MISESRVTILVKASPQPSKSHQETVCCAGLTDDGSWRRLFPIRFRHLAGEQTFKRWDIVRFSFGKPKDDLRWESCRVHEESISVEGTIKKSEEKGRLIARAIVPSEKFATEKNQSLALIRPYDVSLTWEKRSVIELELAKKRFRLQASQLSMFDTELAAYEPCPYEFKMRYFDQDGEHNKTCGDWETSAAYFNLIQKY